MTETWQNAQLWLHWVDRMTEGTASMIEWLNWLLTECLSEWSTAQGQNKWPFSSGKLLSWAIGFSLDYLSQILPEAALLWATSLPNFSLGQFSSELLSTVASRRKSANGGVAEQFQCLFQTRVAISHWGTKKTDPGFQHFPTQVLATATVYTVSCAVFPPARIHGNTPSLTTAWASVSRISTLSPADMLLLLWSNVSTGDSVNFPTRVTSDVASVFEFLSRKPPIDICNPDAFQLNFICSHTPTHHAQNHRSDIILIYEYTIYIYMCSGGETEDGTIHIIFLLLLLLLLRLDSPSNSYFVYCYFIFLFGQSARVYAPLECRIWNRIGTVHPCKVANCRKDRAGCFKSKLHWGGSSLLVPKSACVSPSHAN